MNMADRPYFLRIRTYTRARIVRKSKNNPHLPHLLHLKRKCLGVGSVGGVGRKNVKLLYIGRIWSEKTIEFNSMEVPYDSMEVPYDSMKAPYDSMKAPYDSMETYFTMNFFPPRM